MSIFVYECIYKSRSRNCVIEPYERGFWVIEPNSPFAISIPDRHRLTDSQSCFSLSRMLILEPPMYLMQAISLRD